MQLHLRHGLCLEASFPEACFRIASFEKALALTIERGRLALASDRLGNVLRHHLGAP
jgi:hypothetical protein